MTKSEMQKKWPAEVVAAGLIDKLSLEGQRIAKRPKLKPSEVRHVRDLREMFDLLVGDNRAPHVKNGRA